MMQPQQRFLPAMIYCPKCKRHTKMGETCAEPKCPFFFYDMGWLERPQYQKLCDLLREFEKCK